MDIAIKRISAYVLDILIITLLTYFLSNIPLINPYMDDYTKAYEEYNEVLKEYKSDEINSDEYEEKLISLNYDMSKYNVVNGSITVVMLILYFGIFQYISKGQTPGKRFMKIKITHIDDDKELKIGNFLIRTVILNNILFRVLLIVGIYFLTKGTYYSYATIIGLIESIIETIIFIMIVIRQDNRGLHDLIAKTKVISTKVSLDNE